MRSCVGRRKYCILHGLKWINAGTLLNVSRSEFFSKFCFLSFQKTCFQFIFSEYLPRYKHDIIDNGLLFINIQSVDEQGIYYWLWNKNPRGRYVPFRLCYLNFVKYLYKLINNKLLSVQFSIFIISGSSKVWKNIYHHWKMRTYEKRSPRGKSV